MRLQWKLFLASSAFVLASAVLISAVVASGSAHNELNGLRERERLLALLAARQVESGYHERIWPFEMLREIMSDPAVIGWKVIDDDGAVALSEPIGATPGPIEIDAAALTEPILVPRPDSYVESWVVPTLMSGGSRTWQFHLDYDTSEVAATARSHVLTNMLIASGMTLLLAPLCLILTRRFVRPLTGLATAARRLADGNHDIELSEAPGDEVGEVVLAFQAMVESIKERDAHIKRHVETIRTAKNDLEERVGERTAALNARRLELETQIAERQRIEEALRESERSLRTLVDYAPEAILMLDVHTRRFVDVNENATRLFGLSRELLLERGMIELSPERQPDGQRSERIVQRRIEDAIAGMTPVFEWVHLDSDGERLDCEICLVSLPRAGRNHVRVSITDISQRKQALDERERLQAMLLEKSRLAGMSEVATGVLHNVGNVLNSVNLSAELVAHAVRSSHVTRVAEVARLLHENSDRLGEFITSDERGCLLPQFLEQLGAQLITDREHQLSEIESLIQNIAHIKDIVTRQQAYARTAGGTDTERPDDLIESALRIASATIRDERVEIEKDYADVVPLVVDKHAVIQILVNLITNACAALSAVPPHERIVRIRVAPSEVVGEPMIRIEVSDGGVGITEEDLLRIFTYGFTTKEAGHGFGLHSCALAAQGMGGSLTANSDGPGTGAIFVLELPVTGHAARAAAEEAA